MAKKLKDLRRAAGLTQVQLARKAGIDQQTVSYHETRATRGPHRITAAKLALALGCNPADFYSKPEDGQQAA